MKINLGKSHFFLRHENWQNLHTIGDSVFLYGCHRVVRMDRAEFVVLLQEMPGSYDKDSHLSEVGPGCWHDLEA